MNARAVEAVASAALRLAIWKMLPFDPGCHDDFDLDSLQLKLVVDRLQQRQRFVTG